MSTPHRTHASKILPVVLVGLLSLALPSTAKPRGHDSDLGATGVAANSVMFGSWAKPRPSDPVVTGNPGRDAVLRMESQIGAPVTVDHVYLHLDDAWPMARQLWDQQMGRIPLINWRGCDLNVAPFFTWAQIANGAADSFIDARAQSAAAYGSTIFLAFHHEPEDDTANCGTAAEYVAAWRHVVARFRAAGATNVKFVLILMAETYRTDTADQWYPGADVIDYVGADGYNWYGTDPTKRWRSVATIFSPFYSWSLSVNKPAMITETGTLEDPADPLRKAQWFADAAGWLPTVPNIKAFVYFSSDRAYPWWADSSSASITSFIALRHQSLFR